MPIEVACPRVVSLVYDGTNSAEVAAMVESNSSIGPNSYSIGSESGGVLTIVSTDRDLWNDIVIHTGDRVVVSADAGVTPMSQARYDLRYVAQ